MCCKAVNVFLSTVRFVADWFVRNKMLAKLENKVILNNDIFFDNVITFLKVDLGFNIIGLNNINIDNDDFDEDNTGSMIYFRVMGLRNRYKQYKACKKYISEEFMPSA